MKFVHLSDLHLGKRVNGFSMLEDQKYILTKILNIIDDENPDGIIIAGDVYDKSVPSGEAVRLLDGFLCKLAKRNKQVYVISGNHDSPERLSFASDLIDLSGIHISPVYDGNIKPFVSNDEYGKVNIYMLPFIKPVNVRSVFPDAEIESYTDAVRYAIEKMNVAPDERNVIVTHQFVTGAQQCESEEISVGGSDNVDSGVFGMFDYVALGHIHGPQHISTETIRYCGTPLKYSFSEISHTKSVTVAELNEKGNTEVRTVPLEPMHDMREIRGRYDDIVLKSNYENTATDDYMRIVLTDEDDIPDVMNRLRVIYPNLMEVKYDNTRTRKTVEYTEIGSISQKTEMDLFAEFFEKQNGQKLSDEQEKIARELFEEIKEGRR